MALCTAHTVLRVDGELLGNHVEVEMLHFAFARYGVRFGASAGAAGSSNSGSGTSDRKSQSSDSSSDSSDSEADNENAGREVEKGRESEDENGDEALSKPLMSSNSSASAFSKLSKASVKQDDEDDTRVRYYRDQISTAGEPKASPSGAARTRAHSQHSELLFETIRGFEFDQQRQLQSVVVRTKDGRRFLFTKGAYESVGPRCVSTSIPAGAQKTCVRRSADAYYVIALAYRELSASALDPLKASRDELERELSFLGLLYFRNELRADSRAAILRLRHGGIKTLMVTGDNVHTGVSVARKCGIVGCEPGSEVIIGDVLPVQ